MKKYLVFFLALLSACSHFTSLPENRDKNALGQIAQEVANHGHAFEDLKELTEMGPRLCGSVGEKNAQQWAMNKLKTYGSDKVWLQAFMAPHWVRGNVERAQIIDTKTELKITSLGLAPGTGPEGVSAEVIEVKNLNEVKKLGSKVKGKIIFYNRPMDASLQNTFEAYGKAGNQRNSGPAVAAQLGARAVLVRSLTTLADDDHPHTGMTKFAKTERKVPAAALSTHAANVLSQALASNPRLKVKMELSAEILSPVTTNNVIAEITGRELPNEYVLVGGHLDSWDLAQGAMDDGAGAVQAIEVLRSFQALHLKPRRSIRLVLFACEEIGGLGGTEYAKQALAKHEKHLMGLESDNGGFGPLGFQLLGDKQEFKKIQGWADDLKAFHAEQISYGDSDTDVEPLTDMTGALSAGLRVVPDLYFNYHHTDLDTLQVIDRKDLLAGASAMSAFVYLSSEKL